MSLIVYDGAGRLYCSSNHATNNDGEEIVRPIRIIGKGVVFAYCGYGGYADIVEKFLKKQVKKKAKVLDAEKLTGKVSRYVQSMRAMDAEFPVVFRFVIYYGVDKPLIYSFQADRFDVSTPENIIIAGYYDETFRGALKFIELYHPEVYERRQNAILEVYSKIAAQRSMLCDDVISINVAETHL